MRYLIFTKSSTDCTKVHGLRDQAPRSKVCLSLSWSKVCVILNSQSDTTARSELFTTLSRPGGLLYWANQASQSVPKLNRPLMGSDTMLFTPGDPGEAMSKYTPTLLVVPRMRPATVSTRFCTIARLSLPLQRSPGPSAQLSTCRGLLEMMTHLLSSSLPVVLWVSEYISPAAFLCLNECTHGTSSGVTPLTENRSSACSWSPGPSRQAATQPCHRPSKSTRWSSAPDMTFLSVEVGGERTSEL